MTVFLVTKVRTQRPNQASVGALGAALAQKAARANEAIEAKRDAMASEGKPDEEVEAAIAPLNAAAAEVSTAQAKLSAVVAAQSSPPAALLQFASSELAEKLDAELGSTITDHSIFDAHGERESVCMCAQICADAGTRTAHTSSSATPDLWYGWRVRSTQVGEGVHGGHGVAGS